VHDKLSDHLVEVAPLKKPRGRKRALTQEQVYEIRHAWIDNNNQWAEYRSNPNRYTEPRNLSMTDLAARYRVSAGVIQHVIDHTRAYK
jgi:hypothetical protein